VIRLSVTAASAPATLPLQTTWRRLVWQYHAGHVRRQPRGWDMLASSAKHQPRQLGVPGSGIGWHGAW
jgi:GMP synthase-like glutamine amidotransferase